MNYHKTSTIFFVIFVVFLISSCATPVKEKSYGDSYLYGTWEHIGRECDSSGHNCSKVHNGAKLTFERSGRFLVNGSERGSYQLDRDYMQVSIGEKTSIVQIIYISERELVTREKGNVNIDRFHKIFEE